MVHKDFWSSVHKCIQDSSPKPKTHYLLDKEFWMNSFSVIGQEIENDLGRIF